MDNLSKPASTKPVERAIINKEAPVNYIKYMLMRIDWFDLNFVWFDFGSRERMRFN